MLTSDRIDAIFKEMDSYVLELASEPGMLGPQYFQDIIAKCRNYLNKASLVTSELNRERLAATSELRNLEAVYSLDYDNLLANDERVKSLANIDDRKSTVGYLLRQQRQVINEVKDRVQVSEAVYKVVAHRNRELHATMNAIKDQRRLMNTELSTGAFYGDERVKSNPSEDLSESDLAALMNDPEPQTEADPTISEGQNVPKPQSVVVPSASKAQEDEDLDALLANL
jgi:hypothetical protein